MSEQPKRRGGWSNPASATNGSQGGRLRLRYTLSRPTALMLRELTRSLYKRKDVSDEEVMATLEDAIRRAADQRLAEIEQSGLSES
jgi:hypothetical protein